jgi:acetyltransferase-like isoleucine patch superfamily enzyme
MYSLIRKIVEHIYHLYSDLKTTIILKSFNKDQLNIGKNCIFNGPPIFKITIDSHITLGDNCIINSNHMSNPAGVIMPCYLATTKQNASIKIGNNVGMSGVSIVAAKAVSIGHDTQIGAGSCIWDNDFHPIDPTLRLVSKTKDYSTKEIYIGENVFIGARSIILKGVTIGKNSVIGAGSIVSSDVPENSIYAGNPAHLIKKIES